LNTAKLLGPDLPETHVASGSYLRLVREDLAGAAQDLEAALGSRPNDYEALHELGFIHVQLRQLERARSIFEHCEVLNPLTASGGMDARMVAWGMRDWDDALQLSKRYLTQHPDDAYGCVFHAKLLIDGFGDLQNAAETLDEARRWGDSHPWPEMRDRPSDLLIAGRAYVAYFKRNFAESVPSTLKSNDVMHFNRLPSHMLYPNRTRREVKEYLDSAEAALKGSISRNALDGTAWLKLAMVQVIKENIAGAKAAARQAESLPPPNNDPWMNNECYPEWLASVNVMTGEYEKALATLEGLLARPGWLTVWKLRLDPIYDPLRNDPRFQALLVKDDRSQKQ
jgi:tetratricopeptide (TPR) repeat protein